MEIIRDHCSVFICGRACCVSHTARTYTNKFLSVFVCASAITRIKMLYMCGPWSSCNVRSAVYVHLYNLLFACILMEQGPGAGAFSHSAQTF